LSLGTWPWCHCGVQLPTKKPNGVNYLTPSTAMILSYNSLLHFTCLSIPNQSIQILGLWSRKQVCLCSKQGYWWAALFHRHTISCYRINTEKAVVCRKCSISGTLCWFNSVWSVFWIQLVKINCLQELTPSSHWLKNTTKNLSSYVFV